MSSQAVSYPSAHLFERVRRAAVSTWVNASPWDQASWVLLSVVAVLIAFTFRHYGITWDEPIDTEYGKAIGLYYVAALHGHYNPSAAHFENVAQWGHSGGFDTTLAALNFISPFGKYETRHLLSAIIGLLGIVGCWKLARLLGGPRVAFLAALLLAVTGRYYGGMFNDAKDVPFAAFYIWSVYYLLRLIPLLPRVPWSLAAKLGLAIGATLSIRVGGLLLLCYLGLIFGIWWIAVGLRRRSDTWHSLGYLATLFIFVTALAWVAMLIFWPWAQLQPFQRPLEALSGFSHYDWTGPVLFGGRSVMSNNLPRIYLPQWLAITLPEIYFLGLGLGILWTLRSLLRPLDNLSVTNLVNWSAVAFAGFFPLLYAIVKKPVLYDGARHFLFVVPPLACLAAGSLWWVAPSLNVAARRFATAILVVYFIFEVVTLIRLHPDEYVYFNQFVGGLPGAYGRYETDYWGNSYREAVMSLEHLVGTRGAEAPGSKYKIYLTSINRSCVTYFFPKNFLLTYNPAEADFFIATTRFDADKSIDAPIILTVERLGVPLAVVKDLSADKAPQAKSASAQ
jgi:hypothetical protein